MGFRSALKRDLTRERWPVVQVRFELGGTWRQRTWKTNPDSLLDTMRAFITQDRRAPTSFSAKQTHRTDQSDTESTQHMSARNACGDHLT